jgi:flavorubredoxin
MLKFTSPSVVEIVPDVYRICLFAPELQLQFNYFLVRDDEPLLFTTGFRGSFPAVREAVGQVLDPASIRWIGFSHFESDECGALNLWLEAAPCAQPVCGIVSAAVNVSDFADRPPRGMADGEVLQTGRHRFRFCATPQFPHGWDAGLLFEETGGTLFCSDLFHHNGDVEAMTEDDLTERVHAAMRLMQAGPLANYVPYTGNTESILARLADLKPRTLAIMHGSSFAGDGERALRGLAVTMRDVLGP